jgi:hypothetical protein
MRLVVAYSLSTSPMSSLLEASSIVKSGWDRLFDARVTPSDPVL